MTSPLVSTPPSNAARLRVVLAGVCALILTVGLARFAYTPLLPVMREQAGLSYLAGGWLAAANYAGYIAGALVAATTADLGRKFHYYRIGLVAAVVSTAAMGLTDDVWLWALLRFVSGMSSTAGLLLASGLVLNWLMRQRHAPQLGLHFTGMGLGIALSGIAAVAMAGRLAWDGQWLALGALGLVFFVPAWRWMPAPAATGPHASGGAGPGARPPTRRWLWLMVATYFCAGFGYVISATFIVAIVEKMPLLAGKGALVWTVLGIAAIPSTLLWDRIARALGPVAALLLAYGLQIVSIALPIVSDGLAWNLVGALLYGGTFAGIVSLALALVGSRFPANPAKAMARLTLGYGAAQIIAPALAGSIAAATGSYQGALAVAAAVMAVGMLLLAALRAPER